jgi:hypothetical protein
MRVARQGDRRGFEKMCAESDSMLIRSLVRDPTH